MKYFFPVLMALVILAGLTLALTPFIAEQFFPTQETTLRKAAPEQVQQALARWFETDPAEFSETRGIKQVSAQGDTNWFTFRVARQPVEHFIRQQRLRQQALTTEVLQRLFATNTPPADWWQPASLKRETFFGGLDEGHEIGLIYHADQQTGFLVIRTREKTNSF